MRGCGVIAQPEPCATDLRQHCAGDSFAMLPVAARSRWWIRLAAVLRSTTKTLTSMPRVEWKADFHIYKSLIGAFSAFVISCRSLVVY